MAVKCTTGASEKVRRVGKKFVYFSDSIQNCIEVREWYSLYYVDPLDTE